MSDEMRNATIDDDGGFDLIAHLRRQRRFSERTFGPSTPERMQGVINHARKELVEIEYDPTDITEWVDLILLALDGAWRAGHSPEAIADAIVAKQIINESRTWPDWRTADPTKAIEHVKPTCTCEPAVAPGEIFDVHRPECPLADPFFDGGTK